MLVRFSVGNFCSFDKIETFSLIAGAIQNHKERLYKANDFKLLKFGAVFGANASGKSNFIKAIDYARSAVVLGLDQPFAEAHKYSFFRLNPSNRDKSTYFEFEIFLDGAVYAYGFEVSLFQKRIREEWLVKVEKAKEEPVFTRNLETDRVYFNEGFLLEKPAERMRIYLDDFKSVANRLFLTEIVSNKTELYKNNPRLNILREVFNWINRLNISYPNTSISGNDCFARSDIDELFAALRTFKTGISKIVPSVITKEQALDKANSDLRNRVEEAIARVCPQDCQKDGDECVNCGLRLNINGRLIFVSFEHHEPFFTEILFEHFGIENVSFSLKDESDGTRRLLDLLSVLFTQKDNSVFVIDEIDRSLHPQLTKHFVKTFLAMSRRKNIQLIITTHESHLLDLNLLRQDEIYFIETDTHGGSVIYPFDRFKERFDKRIEKAYLDGRYGASPLFDAIYTPLEFGGEE